MRLPLAAGEEIRVADGVGVFVIVGIGSIGAVSQGWPRTCTSRRVVEVIAFFDGGLEEPLQHSLHRSQRGYMQEKEEEGLCD